MFLFVLRLPVADPPPNSFANTRVCVCVSALVLRSVVCVFVVLAMHVVRHQCEETNIRAISRCQEFGHTNPAGFHNVKHFLLLHLGSSSPRDQDYHITKLRLPH